MFLVDGKYVGQVGTENLVPDKNNLKPSKADLRADAKKKAITTKKGPIYKESSKQEDKDINIAQGNDTIKSESWWPNEPHPISEKQGE